MNTAYVTCKHTFMFSILDEEIKDYRSINKQNGLSMKSKMALHIHLFGHYDCKKKYSAKHHHGFNIVFGI